MMQCQVISEVFRSLCDFDPTLTDTDSDSQHGTIARRFHKQCWPDFMAQGGHRCCNGMNSWGLSPSWVV